MQALGLSAIHNINMRNEHKDKIMIGEGFAGIGAFSREFSEEEEKEEDDVDSNCTEDMKKTLL